MQVEGKLFGAVDALAEQNAKMSANIVRQRRQQLLNTFEKVDLDMDTVRKPPHAHHAPSLARVGPLWLRRL